MNVRKLTLAMIGSATLALTLGAAMPANAADADIAIVLKTLSNPYWVSMKDGILSEAKKRGVTVDVVAGNSEDDIQGQQRLAEDMINKNYKAIGIAPISPVSLVQAVANANKKGIYVVNVDEKIDQSQLKAAGGSVVAFIATDNLALGKKAGGYIVSKLGASGGKVAIIEGKAGNASGDARRDGATAAFKAAKGVQLVASQPADWDRSKALDVTTNILQRNPDLKAIYAANDTMALGALQAVKNADKLGKIIVVGTDGAPEAIDSVKHHELTATAAQDSAAIGAKSVDVLLDALKTKPAISPDNTPTFIAIDSNLVTQ
ncbi:D-allose ABC transporter periplasmic binding protein [Pararobbsia alpina]|uniref:D-allose transporter substrate-binding protein n=1 Tax=Pararobbsia alpina TaxID=621374 RepID=UPI0039A5F6F5